MQADEIQTIIEQYGAPVYSFCCSLTGNRADADDLYQETFLKAIELCHRLNRSGNVKSYLMGISLRIWKNKIKKDAIRNRILPYADFQAEEVLMVSGDCYQPETEFLHHEQTQLVYQAIASLPPNLKGILCMYYTGGLAIADISRATHLPSGTVKSRLHKGRKLIKEHLEENHYGDERS